MESLENKVIVITGANGGMGVELVKRLAGSGAKLALCSRTDNRFDELAKLVPNPDNVMTEVVDVTVEKEVENFFKKVADKFGKVHYLFNLAGLSIIGKIWETTEETYDTIIDVNLKGTFLMSKHFVPLADPDCICKIINVSSVAAVRANGNAPLYCTAKAAVNMFSDGLAIQVKEKKIQVTTLNPGAADTPFWGNRPVDKSKFMKAEDIAEIMEYILRFNHNVYFRNIYFESFWNV